MILYTFIDNTYMRYRKCTLGYWITISREIFNLLQNFINVFRYFEHSSL